MKFSIYLNRHVYVMYSHLVRINKNLSINRECPDEIARTRRLIRAFTVCISHTGYWSSPFAYCIGSLRVLMYASYANAFGKEIRNIHVFV